MKVSSGIASELLYCSRKYQYPFVVFTSLAISLESPDHVNTFLWNFFAFESFLLMKFPINLLRLGIVIFLEQHIVINSFNSLRVLKYVVSKCSQFSVREKLQITQGSISSRLLNSLSVSCSFIDRLLSYSYN